MVLPEEPPRREDLLAAAEAVVEPSADRIEKRCAAAAAGSVRFWRCQSERAQAQAVAAETERLVERKGVAAGDMRVFVPSLKDDGPGGGRGARGARDPVPPGRAARAYFQRAEVRDLLAWLRALADPSDAGAVVRALSRPPVDLRSVDIALITQLVAAAQARHGRRRARRARGPAPVARGARPRPVVPAPLPRRRAGVRATCAPDAFVHRLIERIGLRRQQLFAAHADTLERLMSIAKLGELATAYMRREPQATPRDFARYIAAVAESGLPEQEPRAGAARRRAGDDASTTPRGCEFDHVFVLGLTAQPMPGPRRADDQACRTSCCRRRCPRDGREAHEERMRRVLYVAMTRARRGLVLSWAERERGARPRRRRSSRRRGPRCGARRSTSRRSCSAPPRASTRRSG